MLCVTYCRGPPALLLLHLGAVSRERFSAVELTKEYIKSRQTDEAVSLLAGQNWDTDGAACYSCLSAIINHLLRQPLNADREGEVGRWEESGVGRRGKFVRTPELRQLVGLVLFLPVGHRRPPTEQSELGHQQFVCFIA